MTERTRPIIWSSDARSDLSEVCDYYLKVAGRDTADRIVRRIGEAQPAPPEAVHWWRMVDLGEASNAQVGLIARSASWLPVVRTRSPRAAVAARAP